MEASEKINFFNEEIKFNLQQKKRIREWLISTAQYEKLKIDSLNYIFCSDDYLLKMNQQYLKHDTLTDIITFQHDSKRGFVSGDVFISIHRIHQNAVKFQTTFNKELHRVMVHGLLHLCGYKDKGFVEKSKMRTKEDFCLAQIPHLINKL